MSNGIATGNPPKIRMMCAALLALAWMAAPGRAQEDVYDVLGKALMPIANVFALNPGDVTSGTDAASPAPGHALVLDAHLVAASKLPPQLQGQAVHVALMTPDKLLVRAPIAGQILTVCRDGDTLWATPGSRLQALLNQAAAEATPGKKKKKHAARILGPLVLPVPQKELVFLPILFQVADAGTETVGGQPCRVLDVQLMAQLAKSLHAEDWSARMWVGADYGIVQVALTGPDWSGTVAIDKLAFPEELPDAAFQPQGTDVLWLTPQQFLELMGEVGRK